MNRLIIISLTAIVFFFIFNKGSVLGSTMPQHQLSVYGQDEFGSIDGRVGGKCIEAECLTIYVAPWCPQCGRAKPMILKLTEELRSEGIDVTVVVGNDSEQAVQKYAKDYPFPVLLDADKGFYNKTGMRGVPFFISSNREGKIIQSFAGFSFDIPAMRQKLEL